MSFSISINRKIYLHKILYKIKAKKTPDKKKRMCHFISQVVNCSGTSG